MREAELGAAPENELLADPRQVREEHGRCVEVVEREVPVGDRVERVAHRAGRQRQGQRRAGEGTGAEWARHARHGGGLEAAAIALEHLHPRVQVVADRDGLRALEVRVPGQRRRRLALGDVEDRLDEPCDRSVCLTARVLDVEARRRGDLVVARAAGVDLAPDRPEQPLDRRVDVLVLAEERGAFVRDRRQPRLDLGQLRVGEDAGDVQTLRVQRRRRAVVRQQLGVLGAQERVDLRVERDAGACGPERHSAGPSWSGLARDAGGSCRSRRCAASIRRESAMSLICTASCPIRSAAVNAVALRSMLSRSGS